MPKQQPTVNTRRLERSSTSRAQAVADVRQERREAESSVVFHIGRFPVHYAPLLTLILLAAAALRIAGLDWGEAYYLHPDERYMVMVTTGIQWPTDPMTFFNSAVSTLNPYNNEFGGFLYGTFPVFAAKLVGTFLGDTVYGNAHIPGRWLSALYDVGTVAVAAWAARMLYGRLASIFAATLLAFTALMIQTAHYFTTDSAVVFFSACVIAFSIKSGKTPSLVWYALAGLSLGLATASKPTALAAAAFVAIPLLEHIRRHGWLSVAPRVRWRERHHAPSSDQKADLGFLMLAGSVLAAIIAFLTFRVFQPYAFTGPHFWNVSLNPDWTSALKYWSQVQSGELDYPPGIQWANRTPVVFMVKNMVFWGMAPGFGIIALLAISYAAVRCLLSWRWPSWWTLGLAGWSWFHILYYGANHVPSQRYILPAYPAMAILSGAFLASLIAWARSGRSLRLGSKLSISVPKRWPKAIHPGYLIPLLSIGITIFYGVAFTNIFLKPLTRVEASEWIYANVPAGSTITGEYWDDSLPLCMPDHDCQQYTGVQLYPYAEDDVDKLTTLVGNLDRADYVLLTSRRLIDSIAQMPYRWPMTTAYYQYLFDGSLGFELVATFSSPPSIGPISIDDSSAEESLTVYEHPQVYIFKKTDAWNAHTAYDRLYARLQTGLGDDAGLVIPARADSPDLQLMDRTDQRAYYAEGTWRTMFNPSSWANHFPAFWWYLAIQLLTLPMIPILWRIFPGLPDRGYALAKTGGLIGAGYLAWLIASVRLLQWGPIPILIAWFALWIVAALCLRHHGPAFSQSLRERRAWFIAAELIFLAAFAIAVWIRMQNPNLWNPWTGGEKPMDLAYFNATIRTPFFPPYDPWFRNGTIHYYYWGLVPWAMLTRLTGIIPTTAYNLAVPGVFALFLLNTWSVAASFLAHLVPARPGFAHTRRFSGRIRIMLLALIARIGPAYNLWWNSGQGWANVMFNLFNRHDTDGSGWSWKTPLLYAVTLAYVLTPFALLALNRYWREISAAARRQPAISAVLWLSLLPFTLFALLSLVKQIGLHWLLSFVPLLLVALAASLPLPALRRLAQWFGGCALLHLLVIAIVAVLPLQTWEKVRQYDGIVLTFRSQDVLRHLQPYADDFTFAADGYSNAVTHGYNARRYFLVFGPGSSHARHDDLLTDFRTLAGKNILTLRKTAPDLADYQPYFRSVEVQSFVEHGVTFYMVLGRGFDYPAYRDKVLREVKDRFYRIPKFLPIRSCYFAERYFPGEECR